MVFCCTIRNTLLASTTATFGYEGSLVKKFHSCIGHDFLIILHELKLKGFDRSEVNPNAYVNNVYTKGTRTSKDGRLSLCRMVG